MKTQKYSPPALGMLAGIIIGAGLGVVLFAATGSILFISFAGAGAAIGLVSGAMVERSRKQ